MNCANITLKSIYLLMPPGQEDRSVNRTVMGTWLTPGLGGGRGLTTTSFIPDSGWWRYFTSASGSPAVSLYGLLRLFQIGWPQT